MKMKRSIRNVRCLWSFVLLLFVYGCAGKGPAVEQGPLPGDTPERQAFSARQGQEARQEATEKYREDEYGEGVVSSPFGNIPLRRKATDLEKTPVKPPTEDVPPPGFEESSNFEEYDGERPGGTPVAKRPAEKTKTEKKKPAGKGEIVLNFDNADLYEIIRTLGEILQLNYIVDPNVRGRVTIQTSGRLRREELFPVFFQILEANGLTAVQEGSLYKIVKLKEATQLPISTRFGDDQSELPPGERLVIQIVPLEYISFQEMTKLLTPFVTAGGTIVSHQDSNTLLVVDKASNIEKVLKLIDVFDVDFFENVQHKFFMLQNVEAKETTKTLSELILSYGTAKEDFKLIELERINSLLVISKNPRVFRRVESFLRELDAPIEDVEPRIYVYAVKNSSAAELSNLLNSVFSKTSKEKKSELKTLKEAREKEPDKGEATKQLFPDAVSTAKKVTATPGERVGPEGSGTLKGEIKITADEIRNSLIIEAIPKDYQIIKDILSKIDVLPRQVLIEVTLAEIKLDVSTELGVEWKFDRGSDLVAGLQDGATLGSGGLNFAWAVLNGTKSWTATLKALASEDKVDILSSPSVLASDNKEAKINVSTEIPVATTEYTYDNSNDNLLSTSIQYRNTGVILSVTPHINEYGLVSMDVSQEVSEEAGLVPVGNDDSRQSFFKRSVNTSLTVKNGQTIVIGGLIRENKSGGVAGMPCLGQVPVLSYLFGKKTKSIDKSELIIFITPKVIASLEDVDVVSDEFRERINYDPENFRRPGSR